MGAGFHKKHMAGRSSLLGLHQSAVSVGFSFSIAFNTKEVLPYSEAIKVPTVVHCFFILTD